MMQMEHHHRQYDPELLKEIYWESQTAVVPVCDVETESLSSLELGTNM